MGSPLDGHGAVHAQIREILDRGVRGQGLFWDLKRVPSTAVRRAIRTGSILPITQSPEYLRSLERARERLSNALRPLVKMSAKRAAREAGLSLTPRQVSDLSKRLASEEASTLIRLLERGVDGRGGTRRNLSRVIYNASRRFRRSPTAILLKELVEDVRPHLGLTSKVSSRISRKVAARIRGGLSRHAADLLARRAAAKALAARAAAAARHGILALVNGTRHAAWRQLARLGLLPAGTMKRWRDQGDDRVRPRHAAQTGMGSIPLEQPYPLFGVMHPPAPGFGCRCWDELVLP